MAEPLAAVESVDAGVAARRRHVDEAASVAVNASLDELIRSDRPQGHALPIAA